MILTKKSLHNMERVLNVILKINEYDVKNKYNLTEQTHYILKCLNQNILNEWRIVTLIN